MKETRIIRLVSCILCGVLLAAAALCFIGCNDADSPRTFGTEGITFDQPVEPRGSGATVFYFVAVDLEGRQSPYEIHTDKATVGEALQELGLISGEEGPYGLYVKTVNGITLDYDRDHAYWSFYERDSYAVSGVDKTSILPGQLYYLKAEKG